MVEISTATENDMSELLPLMEAFNTAEGICWRPELVRSALARLLREPQLGIVIKACSSLNGELIGYAVTTRGYDLEFVGPDAFVTELYVRPDYRRRGIGRPFA